MNSPPHKKSILEPTHRYLGVGVAPCQNRIAYVTQVFSSDAGTMPCIFYRNRGYDTARGGVQVLSYIRTRPPRGRMCGVRKISHALQLIKLGVMMAVLVGLSGCPPQYFRRRHRRLSPRFRKEEDIPRDRSRNRKPRCNHRRMNVPPAPPVGTGPTNSGSWEQATQEVQERSQGRISPSEGSVCKETLGCLKCHIYRLVCLFLNLMVGYEEFAVLIDNWSRGQ